MAPRSSSSGEEDEEEVGEIRRAATTTSVEAEFMSMRVPEWREQITVRAVVTSVLLSVVFSFIVCKLNLTTGVIPSLNVAAGLLGFAVVKGYTVLLQKLGLLKQPFTRQENTVIQTCVVASSGIAFSSGTASYLLGMSARIAAEADERNTPINVKNLSLGWIIAFLFVVSFVGLFSIVPLRKMMILDYKLTYPSGTATAYLINSFHTPKGAKQAKKQVSVLFKSFCVSFASAFFQWFFAAADGCGFSSFPTFGLQAFAQRFYFDFSLTYVGIGMICPTMVNVSLLLGAILSWGIMWPLVEQHKGVWYSATLSPSSLHGIQGYRVFISIAMMLGDGLFQVLFLLIKMLLSLMRRGNSPSSSLASVSEDEDGLDECRRRDYFIKDEIPNMAAVAGYLVLAALSTIVVPRIFPQLSWLHILTAYLIAPVLAFCNAYGCGLTDWSLASNYGKLAIILFSAWAGGLANGGVIAGLAACGVMMSIVSTASDLMQDFKTGYLTLASPRAMFVSQAIGTAVGCVVSPLVFWLFYMAYPVGNPGGSYPAPYGLLYRGIALLGAEGVSSFPKYCLVFAAVAFAVAFLLNVIREVLRCFEKRYGLYRFVPSPMCLAIPFYLGGYFAVDMCIGSLLLFVWRRSRGHRADELAPAVASGLICGESLWGIPAAVLAIAGVNAPICMKFLSATVNGKVDTFLTG